MTVPDTIVAADIGNSTINLAMVDPNFAESHDLLECIPCFSIDDPNIIDAPNITRRSFLITEEDLDRRICEWIDEQVPHGPLSWWVSTVNHATSRPLQAAVLSFFGERCRAENWKEIGFQDVPLRVDVDAPERVGIDRLLGAYAATVRCGGPLVVVDAGSAVTVDLVVRCEDQLTPTFAGGAIFPGIRLQHSVLATGTEALRMRYRHEEAIQDGTKPMSPGRNTDQAIRLGVSAAVAGGIDRLYHHYSQTIESRATGDRVPPRLVLSGGDAKAISRLLCTDHVRISDLVCIGLLDLAEERCPNRA